jgi:hypothetical protein
MDHDDLAFAVGEVFPTTTKVQEQESARVVQFLVAVRPVVAIGRSVSRIPEGSPCTAEDFNVALVLSLGAAKEAADAFSEADRHGDFTAAFSTSVLSKMSPESAEQVIRAYERLQRDCSKAPGSLLKTVVSPMRDYVGFHWGRGEIADQLAALRDERYSFYQACSASSIETPFPFLTDLMERLRKAVMPDSSAECQQRLAQMYLDLSLVSSHVFSVRVRKSAWSGRAAWPG